MLTSEAEDVILPLTIHFTGMDAKVFADWVAEVESYADPEAALKATRQIVQSRTRKDYPPFGEWLQAYRSIAKSTTPHRRDLAAVCPPMVEQYAFAQRFKRQCATQHPLDAHDHHSGVERCPVCRLHRDCSSGHCPRCNEIAAVE